MNKPSPEGMDAKLAFTREYQSKIPFVTHLGLTTESLGHGTARLVFEDWGPKVVEGVPFALVDPMEGRVPNAVLLNGGFGKLPPKMPKSVTLPFNSAREFATCNIAEDSPICDGLAVKLTSRL